MSGDEDVPTEIVRWLDERLRAVGRRRIGPVTVPRRRPWGTVMRAETDGGVVWLKMPAAGTVFEVALYPVLHRLGNDRVLAPIAVDVERGWLLLPDGGKALLDAYDDDDVEAALIQVLPRYGELQRALMGAVPELLDIGVADMRAPRLGERFDEALSAAAITSDVRDVARRRDWFAGVVQELAGSPVPASLDHADLHSGNVLVDGGRVYDWGDSVVGHPFGSMLVTLRGVRSDKVWDAYLEAFSDLASRRELLGDLRNAMIAGNVVRALTWHRALAAEGYENAGEFAAGPAAHMRQLLTDAPWECP